MIAPEIDMPIIAIPKAMDRLRSNQLTMRELQESEPSAPMARGPVSP